MMTHRRRRQMGMGPSFADALPFRVAMFHVETMVRCFEPLKQCFQCQSILTLVLTILLVPTFGGIATRTPTTV